MPSHATASFRNRFIAFSCVASFVRVANGFGLQGHPFQSCSSREEESTLNTMRYNSAQAAGPTLCSVEHPEPSAVHWCCSAQSRIQDSGVLTMNTGW